MIYHVCLRKDGRVVLDREIVGFSLEQIEVQDPPMVWGWEMVGVEWTLVKKPAYHVAYAEARQMVIEIGRVRTPEGWFLSEAAYRDYVRGGLGGAD
jgi:hypothetical protein